MYTLNLIRALARVDGEHDYAVFARSHTVPLLTGLPSAFRVVDMAPSRGPGGCSGSRRGCLRAEAPRSEAAAFAASHDAAALLSCPRVLTVHDVTFFILPQRYPVIRRVYFQS
jgi:hypothetical protein